MHEVVLKFKNIDEAKSFVDKCNTFEEDIDYIYGHLTIDAKSILGVLSAVEYNKPIKVVLHSSEAHVIDNFEQAVQEWKRE